MKKLLLFLTTAMFLVFGITGYVGATTIELITNGGFETGTSLGWTVTNAGSGNIDVVSGNAPPNGVFSTVGPAGGTFYAVSSQGGPGTHAIWQTFTVPGLASSVSLSYDMFVQTQASLAIHPNGLDHTVSSPNQHARVDILSAIANPFDTGAGVLGNFYLGLDGTPTQPYTSYSHDITSIVGGGGSFILRFAEVDNQGFFNLGVDNVSTLFDPVPEPSTMLLFGFGILGIAGVSRRRKQ